MDADRLSGVLIAAPSGAMLAGAFQDFVVRGRLVLVVVGLDVVPAHGMVNEAVPHQDAAQVGMAVEDDAEEVEDLALLELGAAPDGSERGQMDRSARSSVRMRRMSGPCFCSIEKRW